MFAGASGLVEALEPRRLFNVAPTAAQAADLSIRIVSEPAQPIVVLKHEPGVASAAVQVRNPSSTRFSGKFSVDLVSAGSPAFAANLPILGSRTVQKVNLRAGASRTFLVRFSIPAGT